MKKIIGTFFEFYHHNRVGGKYWNDQCRNYTEEQWEAKVDEIAALGMEYIVLMESSLVYDECAESYFETDIYPAAPMKTKNPISALMRAAERNRLKVFMSCGFYGIWYHTRENITSESVKERAFKAMKQLYELYGNNKAFYGWYLPVEDCLGPVLTDYAVEAVNALTARARELTPAAKILISPYGIFNSDFHDPRYEEQLSRLEVDIIAYQDEIGCVRERYPLTNLRSNWKKLRAIHDKTGVEMWANCETFAWERGTNDRTSALVPAPFPRLLSQLAAATEGGAERIVSFIMCGLFDDPASEYPLGQPEWSAKAYEDYMTWLSGDEHWALAEDFFIGNRGPVALEDVDDPWDIYAPGSHEIVLEDTSSEVIVRLLNCHKDGIVPPAAISLYTSKDGKEWTLTAEKQTPVWKNTGHDAFVDMVVFENLPKAKHMKLAFTADNDVYLEVR